MVQSGRERAPLAPRAGRSLVVSPPLLLQRRAGLPRRAQRGPQAVIVRVRGSVDLPRRRRRIHHGTGARSECGQATHPSPRLWWRWPWVSMAVSRCRANWPSEHRHAQGHDQVLPLVSALTGEEGCQKLARLWAVRGRLHAPGHALAHCRAQLVQRPQVLGQTSRAQPAAAALQSDARVCTSGVSSHSNVSCVQSSPVATSAPHISPSPPVAGNSHVASRANSSSSNSATIGADGSSVACRARSFVLL